MKKLILLLTILLMTIPGYSWTVGGWDTGIGLGDITEVWDCSSGDCRIITIGESEGLIGGAVDGTTDPYITLPQGNDCSSVTAEGSCCWDADDDKLYCGDGTAAVEVGGGGGAGTDDQTIDVFSLNVNTLQLSLEDDGEATKEIDLSGYLDNTDAQDLTLVGNTLAISGDPNTDVDLSGYLDNTDTQLTQEQVEDYAGGMFTGNTETLITATYQVADNTVDLVVDNDLANYSNANSAFLTAEVDGSTTNELNIFTLPDANATEGTAITFADTGIMTISEVGDTITFDATEVDGSTTNEINTITAGDANATEGLAITFVDGGIISTTEAADSITITATEAQDIDAVLTIGATADTENLTLTAGTMTSAVVDTPILQDAATMQIRPSGDADDYITMKTDTNISYIGRDDDDDLIKLEANTVTIAGTITATGLSGSNTGDDSGTDDQTAAEVTIADGGDIITGENVETALQENRTAIDLNTAKVTDDDDGVDEAYTSGWNADTDCPEKDDVYDYLHLIDTDDDGKVDTIDDDVVVPDDLANADWGDFTVSSGSATLDSDVVSDNEMDYTNVTLSDFTIDAAAYDFGGVTSLELPNSAAPTTDAAGEIALDTTITDHQPLFQYYDGGENMTIIAFDTAQLPAEDNEILKYDAATDKFVFESDQTGGTGYWTDSGAYLEPTSGEYLVIAGTDQSTYTEGLAINNGGGGDEDDDFLVKGDTLNLIATDAGDETLAIDTSDWDITADGTMTNFSLAAASNVIEADTVLTITGLAPDTATTQATQASITTCANLTTVGTIETGTWASSITLQDGNGAASTVDGVMKYDRTTETLEIGDGTNTRAIYTDGTIQFIFDGGGSAIAADSTVWLYMPYSGTLTGWDFTCDTSATIVIDCWDDTYANFPPTDADSMTNSHEPTITAGVKATDADITDWTDYAITKGEYLKVNVDSNDNATKALLVLKVRKE